MNHFLYPEDYTYQRAVAAAQHAHHHVHHQQQHHPHVHHQLHQHQQRRPRSQISMQSKYDHQMQMPNVGNQPFSPPSHHQIPHSYHGMDDVQRRQPPSVHSHHSTSSVRRDISKSFDAVATATVAQSSQFSSFYSLRWPTKPEDLPPGVTINPGTEWGGGGGKDGRQSNQDHQGRTRGGSQTENVHGGGSAVSLPFSGASASVPSSPCKSSSASSVPFASPPHVNSYSRFHQHSTRFSSSSSSSSSSTFPPLPWSTLDLSNAGLRSCSPSLVVYSHLTALYLNNNLLSSLPEEIFKLPKLTHLDIANNHLTHLPPELGKLVSLKTLVLSNNRLVELPNEVGRLFRLHTLDTSGNPISSPPMSVIQRGATAVVSYLRDRGPPPPAPPPRNWKNFKVPLLENGNPPTRFKVSCYNVLADAYTSQDRYFYCPSWALNWEFRKEAILTEISAHEADVVCLQEVESGKYRDYFKPKMAELGYDGVFQPKSRYKTMDNRDSVDGCVTFYKKNKLKVIEEITLEFQTVALSRHKKLKSSKSNDMSGMDRLMSKDNVGLVVMLEYIEEPADEEESASSAGGKQVLIVNTHIHWDPTLCDVKLMQTQMLMEELEGILKSGRDQPTPVVICGDFNSMPDSAVYELLASGEVSGQHKDLQPERFSYGFYNQEGLKHDLKLKSAYAEGLGAEPSFTNYTGDFIGCLDYIWFTSSLLDVAALSEPFSQESLSSPLPNAHCPSDHIPLLVEFAFQF